MRVYQKHAGDDAKLLIKFHWPYYIVYVMCLMFVIFVFENKNNLLVKKRVEKQDSKPVYGFLRFAVLLLMTSQV